MPFLLIVSTESSERPREMELFSSGTFATVEEARKAMWWKLSEQVEPDWVDRDKVHSKESFEVGYAQSVLGESSLEDGIKDVQQGYVRLEENLVYWKTPACIWDMGREQVIVRILEI